MTEKRLDSITLEAWRLFITAHARLIDRIDKDMIAAKRIPLHWYDVLIELAEAPDHRLRMSELAEHVVLSRSGLTRLVDKLEQEGLLRRERDPHDGRGAYAVITDKGHDAMKHAWAVYAGGIADYFGDYLTPEEARLLTRVFLKMLDRLR